MAKKLEKAHMGKIVKKVVRTGATGSKNGNEWMRGLGMGTTKGQLETAYSRGKSIGAAKGFVAGAGAGAGAAYLASNKTPKKKMGGSTKKK